jgi:flagellar biosynthesis/type III secretory pathway ATPase
LSERFAGTQCPDPTFADRIGEPLKMKYRNVDGVTAGGRIIDEITLTSRTVVVNDSFVGTVIDGSGEPIVGAPGARRSMKKLQP